MMPMNDAETEGKIAEEIRDAAGAGPSPQEKIMAEAAQSLAQRFGAIVTTAKGIGPRDSRGKPTAANTHAVRQAENKLKHFERAIEADPEEGESIGVRLATMNRAQRRAFLSDLKRAKKKARRRVVPLTADDSHVVPMVADDSHVVPMTVDDDGTVTIEGKNTMMAFGGFGPEDADAGSEDGAATGEE